MDEDKQFRAKMSVFLAELEHEVCECDNRDYFTHFHMNTYDLTLIDYNSFKQLEPEIKQKLAPSIQNRKVVFALTADGGTMDMAINAMRWGTVDFFPKPVNTDHLVLLLDKLDTFGMIRKEINKGSHVCASARNRLNLQETYDQEGNNSAEFNRYRSYRKHAMDTLSMGVFSKKLEEVVNQAYKYAKSRYGRHNVLC